MLKLFIKGMGEIIDFRIHEILKTNFVKGLNHNVEEKGLLLLAIVFDENINMIKLVPIDSNLYIMDEKEYNETKS